MVSKLKHEVEEKQAKVDECEELISSLQSKLKQLRTEFTEEKNAISREKRELEEVNDRLRGQAEVGQKKEVEIQGLKLEIKELKEKLQNPVVDGATGDQNKELMERLRGEELQNKNLNESIAELKTVMRVALGRIYPDLKLTSEVNGPENETLLEKFAAKMKEDTGT